MPLGFLSKTHKPCLIIIKISNKPKLREFLQNLPVLYQTVKVSKNKESLSNCQFRGAQGNAMTKYNVASWIES